MKTASLGSRLRYKPAVITQSAIGKMVKNSTETMKCVGLKLSLKIPIAVSAMVAAAKVNAPAFPTLFVLK